MKKELCYFCPDPREQDSLSLNIQGKHKRVYAVCVLKTNHDSYPACKFHADYYMQKQSIGGFIPQDKEQAEKLLRNGGYTL